MNLLEEFKNIANKLKKTQRIVFKKQDTKEVANEFNQLAVKFDKLPNLADYGGLCFLGVTKCFENSGIEAQAALMKGARMFRKSNDNKNKLRCINNNSNIEGAYRCYSQALCSEEKSVMKACIIREFKEINSIISITSNFCSSAHRVYELELESNKNIHSHKYSEALEKLTEIIEDFSERKCEQLYMDVLFRVEITVLLLLLIISPVNRNSPSCVKIMEKFTLDNENFNTDSAVYSSEEKSDIVLLLEMLVMLINSNGHKDYNSIKEICADISSHHLITQEQKILLETLLRKYDMLYY